MKVLRSIERLPISIVVTENKFDLSYLHISVDSDSFEIISSIHAIRFILEPENSSILHVD